MERFTTEHCEQRLSSALREVRDGFRAALASAEEGGHVLAVLGVELQVDQARRVVVSEAEGWTRREGKVALETSTPEGRARLGRYVGRGRALTVGEAFGILCDLAGERPIGDPARVASFVNLFVVEGALHPGWELTVWLTLAQQLAGGEEKWGAELHGLLPPLVTDADALHRELPADDAEGLRPVRRGGRSSWPEYQMRLLGEVLPEVAARAAGDQTGDSKRELFQAQTPQLLDYVREHVFARVGRALEEETKIS